MRGEDGGPEWQLEAMRFWSLPPGASLPQAHRGQRRVRRLLQPAAAAAARELVAAVVELAAWGKLLGAGAEWAAAMMLEGK